MGPDEKYTAYVNGRLRWLRQIAYALCQDWHRADDLVQTAITRLYVKWRHARGADDLDAYVRVILIRVFLAGQRGGWFSRVRMTSTPSHTPYEGGDHDLATDLRRAPAAVPPRQRATLVLRSERRADRPYARLLRGNRQEPDRPWPGRPALGARGSLQPQAGEC